MRIHKYPLKFDLVQEVELPQDAHILSVHLQGGVPTMWAMVDERAATAPRKIRMYHTGTPAKACRRYLGTLQRQDLPEPWVAHVFED